jgi:hypothetical protein
LEKYTENKLQPSLQPPTQTLKIEEIYSKQASTELAATNPDVENLKNIQQTSFNRACRHQPRR